MFIYDGGEFDIESDHCGVWVEADVTPEIKTRGPPPERWKLDQNTDWGVFREAVEESSRKLGRSGMRAEGRGERDEGWKR